MKLRRWQHEKGIRPPPDGGLGSEARPRRVSSGPQEAPSRVTPRASRAAAHWPGCVTARDGTCLARSVDQLGLSVTHSAEAHLGAAGLCYLPPPSLSINMTEASRSHLQPKLLFPALPATPTTSHPECLDSSSSNPTPLRIRLSFRTPFFNTA